MLKPVFFSNCKKIFKISKISLKIAKNENHRYMNED